MNETPKQVVESAPDQVEPTPAPESAPEAAPEVVAPPEAVPEAAPPEVPDGETPATAEVDASAAETEEPEMPKKRKTTRKTPVRKTAPKRKSAGKTTKKAPARKSTPARKKAPPKRTRNSRAVKSLGLTLKDSRPAGICAVTRCTSKTGSGRGVWCADHQRKVRLAQLRLNNGAWRKRVASGKARHNVLYGGKPTAWAKAHGKAAKKTKAIKGPKNLATITRRELRQAARISRKAA